MARVAVVLLGAMLTGCTPPTKVWRVVQNGHGECQAQASDGFAWWPTDNWTPDCAAEIAGAKMLNTPDKVIYP